MKKSAQDLIYYPVSLNVSGRKCIVVGGGQVAARKVEGLIEHGADVIVVSPKLCPSLAALRDMQEIEVLSREYREGDLDEAFVAIIATDDNKVNHTAAAEAREKRVLVNVVDDADYCDFIAPSHLRRGDISIAITTSGKSPALARKLRLRLEEEYGEEYARLAVLLNSVRSEIIEKKIRVSGEDWQEAIDIDSLIRLLRDGKAAEAREVVLGRLKSRERN